MSELMVKGSVTIQAKPERVWEVLTQPELTEKYMYGCRALSDWKVGSSVLWEGDADGKKKIFVKGSVVAVEPARRLHYTVFDPHAGYRDTPSNYLHVTYELIPEGQSVRFEVTQGDFAQVENGAKRYEDSLSAGGWDVLLTQIKKLAES